MTASLYSTFTNIREYLTPVPSGPSTFKETGSITAAEFLEAGDELVKKFPTWSWESGPISRRKDFLPANKQYLVTRRVPCRHRPKALEKQVQDELEVDTGDDETWVATHTDRQPPSSGAIEDMPDIDMEDAPGDTMDIDDDGDLADWEMPGDDDDTNRPQIDAATLRTRTYDLYITYDKYWRCPRLWLFGYDARGMVLPISGIMEDISSDYVDKTVTMETWPYYEGQSMSMATVHPCKHSHVMQTIIARQTERGDDVRVDQYLVIFLKFMSSVIPTIEHDNTMGF